jgi:hypothetical protein
MTARKTSMLMGLAAALALASAVPALARGPREHRIPKPPRASTIHARGLLGQLIFPCPAGCVSDAASCLEDANSTALSCISDACPTEVANAQSACAADRSSAECSDAVDALATCADGCLATRTDDIDACRNTLRDCRDVCDGDE